MCESWSINRMHYACIPSSIQHLLANTEGATLKVSIRHDEVVIECILARCLA